MVAVVVGIAALVLVLWVLRGCDDEAPGEVQSMGTPTASNTPSEAMPPGSLGGGAAPTASGAPAASLDGGVAGDAGSFLALAQPVFVDAVQAWLRVNADAAERYVEEFCEQSRRLKQRVDLAPRPRQRDAALYLAGRVDWEDDRLGTLHLPAALTQSMTDNAWRQLPPEAFAGLDFTWMQDLAQFDHWSLSAAGPLKDELQVPYYEAPQPNYSTLLQWMKLRLRKGQLEGHLAEASLEVRHLADLGASAGNVIGELTRQWMLNHERALWEDAGQQPPVPLPSREDLKTSQRLTLAQMYFLYPGVKPEVRQRALACAPRPCTAVLEATGATAAMREVTPLASGHLEWLLAQEACDPALAQRIARGPAAPAQDLMQYIGDDFGVEVNMRPPRDGG